MAASDEARLLVRIEAQIRQFEKAMAQATGTADRTARRIETRFRTMERNLGGFGKNALRSFIGQLTAVVGTGALLRNFVTQTVDAEKALAQLEATLKSTGGAAGLSAGELQDLAKEMQRFTAFGDEAVIGAENLLLTFTKIGRDIFPQATETVLDMSTALGQDLKSSAIQLGKALQDPILGITALRRVGVNFSAGQKEVVKQLVETGKLAEAQALILKELQVEFGGSARAARDTLGGALAALGNAWNDLFELEGPAADSLRNSINDLVASLSDPKFRENIAFFGDILFRTLSRAAQDISKFADEIRFLQSLFPETARKSEDSFTDVANAVTAAGTAIKEALLPGDTFDSLNAAIEETESRIIATKKSAEQGLIEDFWVTELEAELDSLRQRLEALTSQDWRINVTMRFAGDLTELERRAEQLAFPPGTPVPLGGGAGTGGGGGGGGPPPPPSPRRGTGGKSPAEQFKEDLARIRERTEALKLETSLIGENVRAREQLLAVQDLINQAERAGLEITPTVIASIEAEAAAFATAAENLDKAAEKFQDMNELAETFGNVAIDAFEGLLDGTSSLNDVLDDTMKLLRRMVLESVLLGQGPLAGLLGARSGGGGIGGLIGGLIGGIGGGAPQPGLLAPAAARAAGFGAAQAGGHVVVEVQSGELFEARVAQVSGGVTAAAINRNNQVMTPGIVKRVGTEFGLRHPTRRLGVA